MSHAYLLAAGNGNRAGGPKAWLEFAGKGLLERQIDFLAGRFAADHIAVSIQDAWRERCLKINPSVRWVAVNPLASPLASLIALLHALPLNNPGFVYHVDMPVWEPELFEMLETSLKEATPEAVIPSFQEERGHPVLLSPLLRESLMNLSPERDRLDHWLNTRQTKIVDVPFSCVLENWNEPLALT